MINFRYHVVSLTAVFLALAIGLVVGTAALNGPVADSLKGSVDALGKDNRQLREQVDLLTEEVNQEEKFATEAAPLMLGSSLAGRRVLLLTLPTGKDSVDGVTKMLTTAGAKITGRVDVRDALADPQKSIELLDLASRATPPSVSVTDLPKNSKGVETSSALLATVLLDRVPAVPDADRRAVLTAYDKAGYLTEEEKVTGPAEAVVVVSGLPYVDHDAGAKNDAVVTMVEQFDKAGVAVVAGSGSGDGNVVSQVRADPALSKTISTVDNGSTAQGQLVAALALAALIGSGQAGHYGVGAGATSLLPEPKG
ncbi:MAG TPA: copper transporter [Micromonosporaceae bacterium]